MSENTLHADCNGIKEGCISSICPGKCNEPGPNYLDNLRTELENVKRQSEHKIKELEKKIKQEEERNSKFYPNLCYRGDFQFDVRFIRIIDDKTYTSFIIDERGSYHFWPFVEIKDEELIREQFVEISPEEYSKAFDMMLTQVSKTKYNAIGYSDDDTVYLIAYSERGESDWYGDFCFKKNPLDIELYHTSDFPWVRVVVDGRGHGDGIAAIAIKTNRKGIESLKNGGKDVSLYIVSQGEYNDFIKNNKLR